MTTKVTSATPVVETPSGKINLTECKNILRTLTIDDLIKGYFDELLMKMRYEAVLQQHDLLSEARKEVCYE